MSYRSRLYNHRNAQQAGENEQPFFTKLHAGNNAQTKGTFFQAKLAVNKPGDQYEQEADGVAGMVVNDQAARPVLQKKGISHIQRLATPDEKKMPGTNEERMKEDKEIQEKPIQRMTAENEEEGIQKMSEPVMEDEEAVQKMNEPQKEEDEKKKISTVQTKQDNGANLASASLGTKIENTAGGGHSLPKNTLHEMNDSFGVDFSKVRIHDDREAVSMNQALQAQAFTHGTDIYFNEGKYNPGNAHGKFLLAHELTHVIQQRGIQPSGAGSGKPASHINQPHSLPSVLRQGLLTAAEEQSAIAFNNSLFDLRSRMIIQVITGATVDGNMGSQTVEAIATFQNANGLTDDGKVGEDTLNAMVMNRVADGSHAHAIQLVTNFFKLDRSQVLSIAFDPSLLVAKTTFEAGGIRVIRVGTLAFLSARLLRHVIAKEIALPTPAVPVSGPPPALLTTHQEFLATVFNNSKFNDPRSVKAIQGLIGSFPDGRFGTDTVERIAGFQLANALTVDGKIGEQTLWSMIRQLNIANQQNSAIRLTMEYFGLSGHGALLDIRFNPAIAENGLTTGELPGPSFVQIGPPAFARSLAWLSHTIAHELEHVRQRRRGILNRDEREFLAYAIEIMSEGMPEDAINDFFSNARMALHHWNRLPNADQRRVWIRFLEVRMKVRQTFTAASAANRIGHRPTMDAFNAIVKP